MNKTYHVRQDEQQVSPDFEKKSDALIEMNELIASDLDQGFHHTEESYSIKCDFDG